MSQETPVETPLGPDKTERDKIVESAIHAKMDAIAQRHEDKILDGIADIVNRYDMPDRSGLPEITNRSGEKVHRINSPYAPLYARMDEQTREIRNPDTDHWCAEFLRGQANMDRPRMMQAHAKLEALDPVRADTLEGAADTTGAFPDGTGGTIMPRVLENIVAIARDRVAKMARFATTYAMTTQEHNIPTAAAMTGYMQGEATSPTTGGEPTLAQVPLVSHTAIVKAIASRDLLDDAAINVVSIFSQRGGAELGALEDRQFFRDGTGSAPNVTALAGTAATLTTDTALSYTNMLSMYTNVQQEYRDNARWFVAANVLNALAQVRDGNGRPFFQGLLDPPAPITDNQGAVGIMMGKPVHEVIFTSGVIWFGDPAAVYAIGRRRGITVEMSRDFYFDTRRVIWLISQRIAGNNVDLVAAQYTTGIVSANSL